MWRALTLQITSKQSSRGAAKVQAITVILKGICFSSIPQSNVFWTYQDYLITSLIRVLFHGLLVSASEGFPHYINKQAVCLCVRICGYLSILREVKALRVVNHHSNLNITYTRCLFVQGVLNNNHVKCHLYITCFEVFHGIRTSIIV